MSQMQSVGEGNFQPIFEGTWDELLLHGGELRGKKLRLTVLDEQPGPYHLARAAAVNAVFGKYASLGVSTDDLHRERLTDKAGEGRQTPHAPSL